MVGCVIHDWISSLVSMKSNAKNSNATIISYNYLKIQSFNVYVKKTADEHLKI